MFSNPVTTGSQSLLTAVRVSNWLLRETSTDAAWVLLASALLATLFSAVDFVRGWFSLCFRSPSVHWILVLCFHYSLVRR